MSAAHTPTPWKVVEQNQVIHAEGDNCHLMVADCFTRGNAAHIVKCVNAHDELVAAVRDAYTHAAQQVAGISTDFSTAKLRDYLLEVLAKVQS